ncbi:MAG: CvpA family protein [Rhodospirillales bacterium]|nr:CvpA family protein [Rhodospirillales bacterium]
MTSADAVLLAVVAISAIVAFIRGFVREVLGVAAWAAAAYVAYASFPVANPLVRGWIKNPQFADPATYGIVFVLGLIVFTIATNLLGRLVRESSLGGLDRTLGLAYGVLRGALIAIVAYMLAGMAIPPAEWPKPVRAARLLPLTHDGAVWLASMLPQRFRPQVAGLDEKNVLPLPRLLTPAVIGGKLPIPGMNSATSGQPAAGGSASAPAGASQTGQAPAIPPAFATPAPTTAPKP